MREAARLLIPELGRPGFDYVLIARGGVITRDWVRLLDDVKSALIRLAAERDGRPRDPTPAAPAD
jgi:ribonuclease P protein component